MCLSERHKKQPFDNEAYDRWESSVIFEILPSLHDLSILDIGCGWGRLAIRFAGSGANVTGVDASEKMLNKALTFTKGMSANYICAGANHLPLENESIDAVICAGLMEHLPPEIRNETFREIHRVLRNNGLLALVINNSGNFSAQKNDFRKGEQLENGYFCQLVDPEEILSTLREYHFQSEKFAANTEYSKCRLEFQNKGIQQELGILQKEIELAVDRDLKNRLQSGVDDRYADHFIIRAMKKS